MARSVPFEAVCRGGLILNSNKFDLLNRPGVATKLRNFEVAVAGGYRRINGYTAFGGEDATKPAGTTEVLGVYPYALGVVAVAGDGIYYSEDGVSWLQVNKADAGGGLTEAALIAETELDRPYQSKAQFALLRGTIDQPNNPYGTLTIATREHPLANFYIDDSGASRLYHYRELLDHPHSAPDDGQYLETHAQHLCVVDGLNEPNTVYYTANGSDTSFAGTGSGSVTLPDHIVGIKSFRDDLFIFCKNSIHRLVEINTPANTAVIPVTTNLGCVDGYTIQEIGGDLVYLAPDGLRTIAGTERIGDVELSSVSRQIQPLINSITSSASSYVFSSAVIREKNQYRLFYTSPQGLGRGVIGTLVSGETGVGFEWSEITSMDVWSISSGFGPDGVEVIYHGGSDGNIFIHDVGNSFNGEVIPAEYQAPDVDFGDLGMRKTLHYVNLSITNEGVAEVTCQPSFDFSSPLVAQPAAFLLAQQLAPAIFGAASFGAAIFGSVANPLSRKPLQGSSHTVAFKFFSEDANPPYTINGYHIEVMPSGRR